MADPKVRHAPAWPPQGRGSRAGRGVVQSPVRPQPHDLSRDRSRRRKVRRCRRAAQEATLDGSEASSAEPAQRQVAQAPDSRGGFLRNAPTKAVWRAGSGAPEPLGATANGGDDGRRWASKPSECACGPLGHRRAHGRPPRSWLMLAFANSCVARLATSTASCESSVPCLSSR